MCVCVCVYVWFLRGICLRDRQTHRDTEIQADRYRKRQRRTDRHIETVTQTDRQTDGYRDKEE